METITNLASNAATTASKLIYGEQPKTEDQAKTATNETAGKEPLSGEQGKGTVSEPFDQGNAATPLDTTANKSTFLDYTDKISSGTEPVSGEQGKGTVTEPFDQGNDAKATATSAGSKDEDFLKLNPTLDGPASESKTASSGDPKIYSNDNNQSYTGMPIVPLNPDVASSGPGATTSTATDSTGTTDKVWKETPLDDISRSGAPGAGPSAPSHVTSASPDTASSGITSTTATSTDPAIKTSAPDSVTAASTTYNPSATSKTSDIHEASASKDTKTTTENTPSTTESRDTPSWATTGVSSTTDASKPSTTTDNKGLASEKQSRKSESGKSPELAASTSNEEKDSKMSHLKEKLKTKLHIGSKDK